MHNLRVILSCLTFGFILTVLLAEYFKPDLARVGLLILIGIGFVMLISYHYAKTKQWSRVYIFILVLILGSLLGTGRLALLAQPDPHLLTQVGQKISLAGKVVAEPENKSFYQQVILRLNHSRNKVLVQAPAFSGVRPGDELVVAGTLALPEAFYTDTGRQFDYPTFLAKDNIFFTLPYAQIRSVVTPKFSLARIVSNVRHLFTGALSRSLPEPENALAAGIVLGVRSVLPKEVSDAFRTVSLSHIIVLSGFNLAVVAAFIAFILKPFPRRVVLGAGASGIILLAMLAGGGAAVIRAMLMGLLALWAQSAGRTYRALQALGIVAVVMIIWSPLVLLHDLGFQLSVVATAGVIIGPALLTPKLKFITERLALRDLVSTTISAQIAVAPLIAYSIGAISLIALPANLLVLPIVPLAMGLSFVVSLFGLISPVLALPVAAPAYLLLHYIIFTATHLAILPKASIILPL
ncbi:MAG: ComEC/Rec2 family competence protein [Candidatus Vogelbacteria bacterium]|nr:ComEC/Rec2 family competence protein [Candidatus Vogelbacteria bacterium]